MPHHAVSTVTCHASHTHLKSKSSKLLDISNTSPIYCIHQEQVPATTNAAKHARSERTTPPLPPRREKSSLSPHPHPHVKYLRALVRPGANQSAHGAGAARGRTPPYVPAGRRSAAHAAAPLAPAAAAREGGAERAQLNVRRQCHMVSQVRKTRRGVRIWA